MPLTAGPSERKNSCSKSKVFPYVGMIKKKNLTGLEGGLINCLEVGYREQV
jgi:hypothetical protein